MSGKKPPVLCIIFQQVKYTKIWSLARSSGFTKSCVTLWAVYLLCLRDEMLEYKKKVRSFSASVIATRQISSMWLMVKVSASYIIIPGDFCRLHLSWMASDVIEWANCPLSEQWILYHQFLQAFSPRNINNCLFWVIPLPFFWRDIRFHLSSW